MISEKMCDRLCNYYTITIVIVRARVAREAGTRGTCAEEL